MKLKIFKGFNKDFLSKLDCEPLYESPIEMKFNIFKLDDIYKDELWRLNCIGFLPASSLQSD